VRPAFRSRALLAVVALLAAAALVVLPASPASSTAGTVDTTWASSGARSVDLEPGASDIVVDLLVETTGKVSLLTTDGTTGATLTRLNADGTLDTTFGTGGTAPIASFVPGGFVRQSDGAYVVAGTAGGGASVKRFSALGVLDTTFGTNGTLTITADGGARDVAALTSGFLVYAVHGGVVVLTRITAAGALDTTWATGGSETTAVAPPSSSGGQLLVQPADQKPVFTGVVSGAGGIFRRNADGTNDTTFGSSGAATISNDVPYALAFAGTSFLVAGTRGTQDSAVLVKRTSTGAADATFAGGAVLVGMSGVTSLVGRAIAVDGSGRVLLAGSTASEGGPAFVARTTAAGVLDTTFGTAGVARLDAQGGATVATFRALGVDGTGRVLAGGAVKDGDLDAAVLAIRSVAATSTTSSTSSTTSTTTVSTGQVAAGGTGRSDAAGTQPSSTNKLVAEVTTPVAGTVSFTKTGGTAVAGHRLLGGMTITAPAGTAANPLKLRFSVDASSVPLTLPVGAVAVLKDKAEVADCEGSSTAAPDPCVLSRNRTGDVITVTVLTSTASPWSLTRPTLQRISGKDRISSAVAVSRSGFADGAAGAVVLARSDVFADALAAAPLAKAKSAPLLLSAGGSLEDSVMAEIRRVLPEGKVVWVLGGTSAISTSAVERIRSWGYVVERLAGRDRYDTAAIVADRGLNRPGVVVETTGVDFPDALAAGAVATKLGGAVLLTSGTVQSGPTAAYLASRQPTRYAIGGPAAKADPGATAIAGIDRYETAVLAALEFFPTPSVVGIASGQGFADALAGSAHVASAGGPLLLLPATGSLPVSVSILLRSIGTTPPAAFLYGGTTAVGEDVATSFRTALQNLG
jgi:uncharacterized delta-60 repeat protein